MENYSYSSYPDSGDSSPRSREIDSENQSWDEPPANYKVKFMCSYGGKIQPRQHDNQLAYVGGDTKILAVERNIKFNAIMAKLSALYGDDNVCLKYQLPGEDLDALISVTNDEDIEHMMLEYDRLYRASTKPARLRLFLFVLNPKLSSAAAAETNSERQWFVDALNSVQIQTLEGSSPSAAVASATNPDFLFGFDKPKLSEAVAVLPEVAAKDVTAGSDCGSEDRHVIGDPMAEIQRQELQRLNISGLEHSNQIPRVNYAGAGQKMVPSPSGAIPVTMQMQIPAAAYYHERQMAAGNYQTEQQPLYFIPSAASGLGGVYSAPPPPIGQEYYGMQRVVQEQPMYNLVQASAPAPAPAQQHAKIGGYTDGMGVVQVGYDGAGRQVYYTTTTASAAAPAPAVGMVAPYQPLNKEGKVLVNAKPQTSGV